MRRSKPLELVMAWREARASLSKFQFVMAAIALGVGALVGVKLFSHAFRDALLREARTLLAADLSVRMSVLPTEEERRVLAGLERRGVESTWTTETLSMVSTLDASRMILTAVKAVEPRRYPFYGRVELQPTGSLRSLLDVHSVVVSRDLLIRLGVEMGDPIRVGAGEFRIAAVLHREPDRMASGFMANLGPRLMLSRTALDRSGLVQHGSRAQHRFLLRLSPRAPPVEAVRQTLEQGFGRRGSVSDFRQGDRRISRSLNRATTFLSLVSLLALVVGGLGVATAIHTHLQQRLDTVAILKCLGGRSFQIARIYLAQAALLALGGSLAGVALGYLVRSLFPLFIADSVSLPTRMQWAPAIAFQGIGVGLLTTLLFTLPPLLAISQVRPALVFRRDMPEANPPWRVRLRTRAPSNLAAAAILAGIGLVAGWLAGSLRLGFLFVGVLGGSVLAMA
ncbi:MAG: ABC transporter permease, partial [Acidobacteria bacterium]|nr:ABC transporter permease [Acidobacteriota bacterium]